LLVDQGDSSPEARAQALEVIKGVLADVEEHSFQDLTDTMYGVRGQARDLMGNSRLFPVVERAGVTEDSVRGLLRSVRRRMEAREELEGCDLGSLRSPEGLSRAVGLARTVAGFESDWHAVRRMEKALGRVQQEAWGADLLIDDC
jgi:hypothetical protein